MAIGGDRTEVIEANVQHAAEELLKRKYGNISIIGRRSLGNSYSSSPASVGVKTPPNGCLVALGAVAILIGIATGAFKPSSQPDAYQQSPSDAASQSSSQAVPQAEPAPAQATWGAFAVSPSSSQSAYSTGYASEDEAKQSAVNSCGNSDCYVLATFGPGYATLAESDKRWFYSHGRASEEEASNDALQQCEEQDPGMNCRVTTTVNF